MISLRSIDARREATSYEQKTSFRTARGQGKAAMTATVKYKYVYKNVYTNLSSNRKSAIFAPKGG